MITAVDQMGRSVEVPERPLRIVSLVPSQTELLHAFGLDERVVGITKFCIHPKEWFTSKTRIGGTKSVNIEKVRALQPDLIIGNKEENERGDIEQLEAIAPVWMSDIFTLEDALEMIEAVGKLCNAEAIATSMIAQIRLQFAELEQLNNPSRKKVMYAIWENPLMVCGSATFVDDLLHRCGWVNCIEEERYPAPSIADVRPDLVLLSSEPYPFKEKHVKKYQEMFPDAHVLLVDGELFSWYGSRLLLAPAYFQELLKIIH